MSVGLGEDVLFIENLPPILRCGDNHQPITYDWNVHTGYECPLCNVIDPEEYAEEQNEELQKEYDKIYSDYRRLQHRSKALINVIKEQEVDDEYFDDDVTDETITKENEDE